jgi:hypothetical protein
MDNIRPRTYEDYLFLLEEKKSKQKLLDDIPLEDPITRIGFVSRIEEIDKFLFDRIQVPPEGFRVIDFVYCNYIDDIVYPNYISALKAMLAWDEKMMRSLSFYEIEEKQKIPDLDLLIEEVKEDYYDAAKKRTENWGKNWQKERE